jgi:hypothetical protein
MNGFMRPPLANRRQNTRHGIDDPPLLARLRLERGNLPGSNPSLAQMAEDEETKGILLLGEQQKKILEILTRIEDRQIQLDFLIQSRAPPATSGIKSQVTVRFAQRARARARTYRRGAY